MRTSAPAVNNKDIKIVATTSWQEKFGLAGMEHIELALHILQKHPVDMLVFEMVNGAFQVRLAGYDLATNSILDEKTVAFSNSEMEIPEKFWFKLDDYGDYYVGTFLFPSEY